MRVINTTSYDKVFDKTVTSGLIHECICCVENTEGDFSWQKIYGGKEPDTPMLMASITKLMTTASIIKLLEEGKLSLEDEIAKHIDSALIKGIHVLKGVDYSFKITISDLLFQKSGLPDWFLDGKESFAQKLVREDFSFSFDEVITATRQLKPIFPPNAPSKAYYSDINFDLLGKIIESITGLPIQEVYYNFIINPLKLKNTYLPVKDDDFTPYLYYRDKRLKRDSFIKSIGASGGVITNAAELMIFIKAFWLGKLFDQSILEKLASSSRLQLAFYPIAYAGGYMSIEAGYPFMAKTLLLGHSGSTGSFAFYAPQKDLFFVGDVNQFAKPSLPVRLVIRLAISA